MPIQNTPLYLQKPFARLVAWSIQSLRQYKEQTTLADGRYHLYVDGGKVSEPKKLTSDEFVSSYEDLAYRISESPQMTTEQLASITKVSALKLAGLAKRNQKKLEELKGAKHG